MARRTSNTLRPLALCGAAALTLSLVLATGLVVPDALAGRAFRADHSEVWQPRFDSSRVPVLTGLAPPKRSLKPDSPNVVLITVDSWRADRLGLYGNPRDTSPFLSELAKTSLVFDRAVATSSWTWPTMVSVATGLYPGRHGVQQPDDALCTDADTIAETLHQAGWRTGFAGSNQYFEPKANGYQQGFEYYWAGGDETYARVLEYAGYFLEGAHEEPFFLHAHLFDPHCPYDPSEAALATVKTEPAAPRGLSEEDALWSLPAEQVVHRLCHAVPPVDPSVHDIEAKEFTGSSDPQDYLDYYDAELLETDQAIRDLAKLLGSTRDWENSWVIITADHGEEFGEHGRLGHGGNLYAETTWVPLIIRPPGGVSGGGRRIKDSVSLVDIAPTIIDAVGLNPALGLDGWSLVPASRGEALSPRTVFAETQYESSLQWWLVERYGRRLLVESVSERAYLYSVDDILDRREVISSRSDSYAVIRAATLGQLIHDERQRQQSEAVCVGTKQVLDEEHKEQLRSLGYTTD